MVQRVASIGFSDLGGASYFRYCNLHALGRAHHLAAKYFNRDFVVSSVYRAVRVAQLRLDARIRSVHRHANRVVVTMDDASPAERSVLEAVRYGVVRVVMHHDARPVFQTINPMLEPASQWVRQDCGLQRPIVDLATQANLQRLDALHAQPQRRVFFCGAYGAQGIPLLESAVASAHRLAQADGFHA